MNLGPAFTVQLTYSICLNFRKILRLEIQGTNGLDCHTCPQLQLFQFASFILSGQRRDSRPSNLLKTTFQGPKPYVGFCFVASNFQNFIDPVQSPNLQLFLSLSTKMEQPKFPSEASSSLPGSENAGPKNLKKPPTPEELISYYEGQGMESKDAAMKVIQDLQGILFKVIGSKSKSKMANSPAEVSRKLDTANTRLAILEMKLDRKPGYLESLAVGVAAGATLKGIGSVVPHVAEAVGQIWNTFRSSSNPKP